MIAATPAPLNLNALNAREDLLPVLTPIFPETALRAISRREKIYYATGSLSNVGALARLRIRADELAARNLKPLRDRLGGSPFRAVAHCRSVPPVEAAPRRAHARSLPPHVHALVRALLRRVPRRAHLPQPARLHRRSIAAARHAVALRHRAHPDGEPARSAARQSALRRFRAGRGHRMRPARRAAPRSISAASSASSASFR